MYTFAIVALLALGTVKLVDFLGDNIPVLHRMRSLVTFIVAIGATLMLDWSMFEGFHVNLDNRSYALSVEQNARAAE